MRILVAEDKDFINQLYRKILDMNGHDIVIKTDGQACIEAYQNELNSAKTTPESNSPFDVVILDSRMPKKNGGQVAKEILKLNPNQRIIFASSFVKETLAESLSGLRQIVTVLQKPFGVSTLIDTIEDMEQQKQLEKFNEKLDRISDLDPTNTEVISIMNGLSKIKKSDIWFAIGDIIVA